MVQEQNRARVKNFLELGRRVAAARLAFGYRRQTDFASFLGAFNQGQISRVESGVNGPPPEMLVAFVNRLALNLNWLFTGKGEMFVSDVPRLAHEAGIVGQVRHDPDFNARIRARSAILQSEIRNPQSKIGWQVHVYEAGFHVIDRETAQAGRFKGLVPILGRIAAGPGAETLEAVQYGPGDAESYIIYKGAPAKAIAVQVVGRSMEPEYSAGDLVIVDPSQVIEAGLACVIQRVGDLEVARLKRIRRRGRKLLLQSTAAGFKDEELPRAALIGAYAVIAHLPLRRPAKDDEKGGVP